MRYLYVLMIFSVLIACQKDPLPAPQPSPAPTNPVPQLSAADIVKGTYIGTADRWYGPAYSGTGCGPYNPGTVPNYTQSGSASIIIMKVNDSSVQIKVSSTAGNFQSFPYAYPTYGFKVVKSGNAVIAQSLGLGNAPSWPHGPSTITFPDAKSINGVIDLSYSDYGRCSSSWVLLEGVSFYGTK